MINEKKSDNLSELDMAIMRSINMLKGNKKEERKNKEFTNEETDSILQVILNSKYPDEFEVELKNGEVVKIQEPDLFGFSIIRKHWPSEEEMEDGGMTMNAIILYISMHQDNDKLLSMSHSDLVKNAFLYLKTFKGHADNMSILTLYSLKVSQSFFASQKLKIKGGNQKEKN